MIKWAHLAHDAHDGYSLPPLEQPTETDAVVQKLSSLEQNSDEQRRNSVEWTDNLVVGDSGCGPTRSNRILLKNLRLFGTVRRFLIFSYDLSVVVSLNVDYMIHCVGY
jgi:hypothetical protein